MKPSAPSKLKPISIKRIALALGILAAIALLAKPAYLFVILPSMVTGEMSAKIKDALNDAQSVTFYEMVPHLRRHNPASDGDKPRLRLITTGGGESMPDTELAAVSAEHILKKVTATSEQIQDFEKAISAFVNFDIPSRPRCYTPHHRVEIVKTDGSLFTVDICFACGRFQIDRSGISILPARWNVSLGRFFSKIGMPPKSATEYGEIAQRINEF